MNDLLKSSFSILGTSKQYVADDYSSRLDTGNANTQEVIQETITSLLSTSSSYSTLTGNTAPIISVLDENDNSNSILIAVYNPLAWQRTEYAQIAINTKSATVINGMYIFCKDINISAKSSSFLSIMLFDNNLNSN